MDKAFKKDDKVYFLFPKYTLAEDEEKVGTELYGPLTIYEIKSGIFIENDYNSDRYSIIPDEMSSTIKVPVEYVKRTKRDIEKSLKYSNDYNTRQIFKFVRSLSNNVNIIRERLNNLTKI